MNCIAHELYHGRASLHSCHPYKTLRLRVARAYPTIFHILEGLSLAYPEVVLNLTIASLSLLPLKVTFSLFLYFFSSKRIQVFFHTDLIFSIIFFKLISYVFPYLLFIFSHGIYKISSAPKVSVSIFIF